MGILGVESRGHAPRGRPIESRHRCPSRTWATDHPATPCASRWNRGSIEPKSARGRSEPEHESKVVPIEERAREFDGRHEESRASMGSSSGRWGAK